MLRNHKILPVTFVIITNSSIFSIIAGIKGERKLKSKESFMTMPVHIVRFEGDIRSLTGVKTSAVGLGRSPTLIIFHVLWVTIVKHRRKTDQIHDMKKE